MKEVKFAASHLWIRLHFFLLASQFRNKSSTYYRQMLIYVFCMKNIGFVVACLPDIALCLSNQNCPASVLHHVNIDTVILTYVQHCMFVHYVCTYMYSYKRTPEANDSLIGPCAS